MFWDFNTIKTRIVNLTQRIESDSGNISLYLNRGNDYCKLFEWDKAMADYDKILELDPDYWKAYSGRGYVYYQHEKWERAVGEFSKALEISSNVDTLTKRAQAYGRMNLKREALTDLESAMKLKRPMQDVAFASGLYYQWYEQYERAVKFFKESIEHAPGEASSYWFSAECLGKLDRRIEAISFYREYISKENPLAVKWINEAESRIAELAE